MQVTYFPYLAMARQEEIDFGFLKIWNFDLKSNEYINDPYILSRVTKIIRTNDTRFAGPVRGIGVVSIGNTDFRTFNQEELELIRNARLILFLSFLSQNNAVRNDVNAGHWCATTENFLPIFQNFQVNSDDMALFNGYVLPKMDGGYRMDRDKFYQPTYIPSPIDFIIDKDLFDYLLALYLKKPRVFKKIIDATELFSESYYNSIALSVNARILCQMGAFEMLLNLPEQEQRKFFKDEVELETSLDNEKKYVHYYESRNAKRRETRTLKGIWADEFYTLRNHIIHGLKIKKEQYLFKAVQRHTDIALLFLVFLVKQQINKSLRKNIFTQRILWEKPPERLLRENKPIFIYKPY